MLFFLLMDGGHTDTGQRSSYMCLSCSREPIQKVDDSIPCPSTRTIIIFPPEKFKVNVGHSINVPQNFWNENYYAFGLLDLPMKSTDITLFCAVCGFPECRGEVPHACFATCYEIRNLSLKQS